MDKLAKRWIEITFILILTFLILSRASGFSAAVRAVGSVYAQSVRALQGR